MRFFICHFFLCFCVFYFSINTLNAQIDVEIFNSKTQFEVGEPIIINTQIRNNTDSTIGFCLMNNYSIYSITHSLPGDSLVHDPATGRFIREGSSHSFDVNRAAKNSNKTQEAPCGLISNEAYIIEPGKVFFFPLFVSECSDIEFIGCRGKYNFLLPKGDYRLDINWAFNNNQRFVRSYEFSIVETSIELSNTLGIYNDLANNFLSNHVLGPDYNKGKKYDPMVGDPLYEAILNDADSILVSKSLLMISDYFAVNEWMLYWYLSIIKMSDNTLMFYLINNLVSQNFLLIRDKEQVIRIYDALLKGLENRERIYSEYLLERLLVKIQYSNNEKYGRDRYSVSADDLKRLKIYSKR